jgi:alpha-tubulin suppressor-like RCC1 family protein
LSASTACLLGMVLALACAGCDETLEVLTPVRDAGHDAQVGCACDEGSVCADGQCVSLPDVRSLAAGADHTCLIRGGVIYCAGSNTYGQLGVNDTGIHSTPTRLRWAEQWFSVAAGAHHTCGLRGQDGHGSLHCWGRNDSGQLGFAANGGQRRGSLNRVGDASDWVQLQCGGDDCCALRDNGALYCWGANMEGGAGQASGNVVSAPMRVAPDSTFTSYFSVGGGHSCAIRSDKALLCWGRNGSGQLGLGHRDTQRTPTEVMNGPHDWLRVAAGGEHTCGIRGDHELVCWGSNKSSQAGADMLAPDGQPIEVIEMPMSVAYIKTWVRIAAGGSHTCALRATREAYCWGSGNLGQLGTAGTRLLADPTRVSGGLKWRELALGASHSCGISGTESEPAFYCWGDGENGKLGVGDAMQRDTPAALSQ